MGKVISIGNGKFQGFTNAVIQHAIDTLSTEGGGVVEIPAGVYMMNDALHLRDTVQVVGEHGTVLRKVPSVTGSLADYLGYGHYEFTVTEPDKFGIGMGVLISDKQAGGFYDTVATIVGRKGDLFFIDRMLNHDYHPKTGGRVTTVFPIIDGECLRNASVKNIVLDGNPEETETLNGCRGGGVFLLQAHNIRLENVEISDYRGDGISFQQCTDIFIRDCHVHDNSGGGVHPGSGSVRYVIASNRIYHNGGYGIFYCLRTTHSLCEGNQINENRRAGISIGERDSDHLIRGNTITGNHGQGIEFRMPNFHGGDRVQIEENVIEGNCRGDVEHEIAIPQGLHDISIFRNRIASDKGQALSVGSGCTGIYFADNQVSGRPQSSDDVSGDGSVVRFDRPADFPPVGPAAVDTDSARHLRVEALSDEGWGETEDRKDTMAEKLAAGPPPGGNPNS